MELAPLAALLVVDFFLVRRQKIDLRSAYGLEGHHSYDYTKGFNIVGLVCLVFGFVLSLVIYNPIKGIVHVPALFVLTPTGCSFLATGILYFLLCKLAPIRRYVRKDAYVVPDKKPFDRDKVPPKQNLILFPLMLLICKVLTARNKLKIDKHNMEGLKPPFLVLGTHHSFTDFYVTPLCLAPYRANYISELEGFENYGEWIYRQVGCLGTRKFINDQALIKNIRRVIKRKGIMVIYPEARYANVGTPSELPLSVAKLVRLLKVPVVIVNMQGNYLLSPIWNLKERKSVRLHADVTCVLSADDAKTKSVEEIHQILTEGLDYDEYKYQRDNNMVIADDFRAEGLHMPLYQCISCKTEFKMITKGSTIKCEACGAEYEMDELGTLHKKGSEDSLYIPDWYDWERQRVNEEIDAGEYLLDTRVRIEALPNSFNFVDCGEGRLVHSEDGFDLTYYNYRTDQMETLHFAPKSTISIHTEYDYRGKGQCVTLSTMDDTFFIYPLEDGFNATKIQFATEYLAKK